MKHPSSSIFVKGIFVMIFLCNAIALNATNIILPPDFNWVRIPPGYDGKTLEIRHHFKPSGVDVILPRNVTLLFKGGSLKTIKSLVANNTTIVSRRTEILDPGTLISGTFVKTVAMPEWFGARGDNKSNDATAVAAAIRAFPEVLFSTKYFIPGINIIINKPITLKGLAGSLIRGDGGNACRFTVKNSLSVMDLSFSGFFICFFFDHDRTIDGVKITNNNFSGIGKPVFASNSNLKLKIINVDINGNRFEQCSSGVELLSWLKYVNIRNNVFNNLGSTGLDAQSNAIRLGNTAVNYHLDTAKGDYVVCGNRISNVFCGPNLKGQEGFECHAVFATGNRIEIINNQIENVYNGGVGSNSRIKTGSEGIYVKANNCTIAGNTLINAGFGEGAICQKDFGTGITISGNTIRYLIDIADFSQLITCYYSGKLKIENNVLESKAASTTALKLCTNDKTVPVAVISGNHLMQGSGYAFRILNRNSKSSFIIRNNPDITVAGDLLKEESTQRYEIELSENKITITNGTFMPSTRFNNLLLSGNRFTVRGTTSIGNLWNTAQVKGNNFEIFASSTGNPLFIMNNKSLFLDNVVIIHGSWKNILMFCNEESGKITGNRFTLANSDGKPERIIMVNTSTPGLSIDISGNSFSGRVSHKNTIVIAISNAGTGNLKVENNTADQNTGTFLEIIAPVQNASFTNNNTRSSSGFTTKTSLQRISGKWNATRTTGLPEIKSSK